MSIDYLHSINSVGSGLHRVIRNEVEEPTYDEAFALSSFNKLLRIASASLIMIEEDYLDVLPILVRSMDELVVDLGNASQIGEAYIDALYYQSYIKQLKLIEDNPDKFKKKKKDKIKKRINKLEKCITSEVKKWLGGMGSRAYMSFKMKHHLFFENSNLKEADKQEIKFVYYLTSGFTHNAPKMTKKFSTQDFYIQILTLLIYRGARFMLINFDKSIRKKYKSSIKEMKKIRKELIKFSDYDFEWEIED